MSFDRANRAYAILLAGAVALYLMLAAASCVLLGAVVYGLAAEDGPDTTAWAVPIAIGFLALNVYGGAIGVNALAAQLASTRRLARRVANDAAGPSDEAARAAAAVGLSGQVEVLDDRERYSFTYGVWRRRVVVSTGLIAAASPAELEAVLAHERYHVSNFDPLKVVVARALARCFFLVPAIRELERRYLAHRELAADRNALERTSRPALAGALMKVVSGPAWPELRTAAAIGGPELLDVRVAQLESGEEPAVGRLRKSALAISAVVLAALAATFIALALAFDGIDGMTDSGAGPAGGGTVAAMAVACALPWIAVGWVALRWLRA